MTHISIFVCRDAYINICHEFQDREGRRERERERERDRERERERKKKRERESERERDEDICGWLIDSVSMFGGSSAYMICLRAREREGEGEREKERERGRERERDLHPYIRARDRQGGREKCINLCIHA